MTGVQFRVYPDSENTIQWLRDRDLLGRFEIVQQRES